MPRTKHELETFSLNHYVPVRMVGKSYKNYIAPNLPLTDNSKTKGMNNIPVKKWDIYVS